MPHTASPAAQARVAALRAALLASAALAILPAPGHAQTAPATPQAAPQAIETVTVTARKRNEKLQKVPVKITVLSGAQLNQNNQNNLQDIVANVPEADFRASSSPKDRTLFVRGVGTISTSPGVEPSVSTVVDGVVLARSGQATLDLVDIDQIEVLSGPQGTLFGRNASAGAINITTLQPKRDFHAWIEGDYFGSGGSEYRVSGGATGALTDKLSANISVLADSFDGNVHNLFDDKEVNGYTRSGFRSKFLYQPSDDFDATLAFDYLKSLDTVPNGVFVSTSQAAYPSGKVKPNASLLGALEAEGITPGQNNTTINNNVTSSADDDNGGVALTLNKHFGDYTLTSITAWRIWQDTQIQDYDQTAPAQNKLPQVKDRGDLLFNQVSQEVRLASPKGGLVDYVVGAYFLKVQDFERYDRILSSAVAPNPITARGQNDFGTDGNDEAIFGEANLNITDNFRLIGGLRGIRDSLGFDAGRASTSPVAVLGIRPDFVAHGALEHYDYAARGGLQWDITPDVNAYFTYGRGYKGPAYNVFFNMAATDTRALNPETNNSYEVGVKSDLFGGRVQANIAGFIEDFSNFQANFADSVDGAIITRLINAGAVTSRGAEASLTTRPVNGLKFGVNAQYDDAHIVHFDCPPKAATSCNINGQPLPFAPRYKLAAQSSYTVPLNDAQDLRVATDFTWQSRVQDQITETPDTIQQAYGIWNANISLLDAPGQWRVTGVVKNILDQHYSNYLVYGDLGGVIRYVPRDDSRYFGIEIRKDF